MARRSNFPVTALEVALGWRLYMSMWEQSKGEASDSADSASSWLRRSAKTPVLSISAVFALLGVIAGAAYSLQFHPVWPVLASFAMFGGAAGAGGVLIGLLFGVPRSTASHGVRMAANTNLEQISDWMTKVFVGTTRTRPE